MQPRLLGHDEARNHGMANDVLADAADEGAFDSSHATSSHHYQLGFLVLSNATDSLSRVLVRLAAHLEM